VLWRVLRLRHGMNGLHVAAAAAATEAAAAAAAAAAVKEKKTMEKQNTKVTDTTHSTGSRPVFRVEWQVGLRRCPLWLRRVSIVGILKRKVLGQSHLASPHRAALRHDRHQPTRRSQHFTYDFKLFKSFHLCGLCL
jgi:hypothetical protein